MRVRESLLLLCLLSLIGCNCDSTEQATVTVVGSPIKSIGFVVSKATVDFEVSNTGEPVQVVEVNKSCKCLAVELSPVIPNGSSRMRLMVKGSEEVPGTTAARAVISLANGQNVVLSLEYVNGRRAGVLPRPLRCEAGVVKGEVRIVGNGKEFGLRVLQDSQQVHAQTISTEVEGVTTCSFSFLGDESSLKHPTNALTFLITSDIEALELTEWVTKEQPDCVKVLPKEIFLTPFTERVSVIVRKEENCIIEWGETAWIDEICEIPLSDTAVRVELVFDKSKLTSGATSSLPLRVLTGGEEICVSWLTLSVLVQR